MIKVVELMTREIGDSIQVWEFALMVGSIVLGLYLTHFLVNLFFKDVISKYVSKEKMKKQRRVTFTFLYATFVMVAVASVIF